MPRVVPPREQIQTWIAAIRPSEYFERLVDKPGLLVLRVKDFISEWRGLHIAISATRRVEICGDLAALRAGEKQELRYRASLPDMDDRDWYNLYTSRLEFDSWWELIITHDKISTEKIVRVRFVHSTVHASLTSEALDTLRGELAGLPFGGFKSELPLVREVRPESHAQAVWLWQWPGAAE